MTDQVKVQAVYYGSIESMIAECSLIEMSQDWIDQNGFKFAVMIIADAPFDPDWCGTLDEARACATSIAEYYGCLMARIY